MLTYWVETQIP